MKKKQTLKQEFVPEEALSPDCHVDAAAVSYTHLDVYKRQPSPNKKEGNIRKTIQIYQVS